MQRVGAAALLVIAVGACRSSATELVVIVETDLQVPGEIDTVLIHVEGPQEEAPPILLQFESSGAPSFPLSMTLLPRNLGRISVSAAGQRLGEGVVSQTRSVVPREGERQLLRLFLSRACREVTCGGSMTCHDGSCEGTATSSEPWPPADASVDPMDASVDASEDGGQDADPPMDSMPDGALDASSDGATDAGADAQLDSSVDAALDSSVDAALDSSVDGAIDTGPPLVCPDGCDDGDPCTDDVCGELGCMYPDNGTCECSFDEDCPDDELGQWGNCDFETICDEEANQERSRTTYACVDRACVPTVQMDMQACIRDTDAMPCDEAASPWSACYLTETPMSCSAEGEEYRMVTSSACSGGSCQAMAPTEESRACTQDTESWSCTCSGSQCACTGGTCAVATGTYYYGWAISDIRLLLQCSEGATQCAARGQGTPEGVSCALRCPSAGAQVRCESSSPVRVETFMIMPGPGWLPVCTSTEVSPGLHVAECVSPSVARCAPG